MRKHFKVGDKVVYTAGNLKDLGERPQGVVVGFDHESSYVDFGRKGRYTHTMGILEDMTGWICYNGHLELAEEPESEGQEVSKQFKVGDKVLMVEGCDLYSDRMKDRIGTIIEDDGSLMPYHVDFGGVLVLWLRPENLELVEDAPKPEAKDEAAFQVGDEVVVVATTNARFVRHREPEVGTYGIVVALDGDGWPLVDFGPEFDGHDGNGVTEYIHEMDTCWWCALDTVEKASSRKRRARKVEKPAVDPRTLIKEGGAVVFDRYGELVTMLVSKSITGGLAMASLDEDYYFGVEHLELLDDGRVVNMETHDVVLIEVYGLARFNRDMFNPKVEDYRELLWKRGDK